jgi:chromosome segregation protein
MHLKSLVLTGFKSFAKKTSLSFETPITAIVGPNGSGKSNIQEAFRFVLGEQSVKSMRGRRGEDLIFNGSQKAQRLNRASVKIVFDNSAKILDIDYDEVVLERVVHRDGVNEYFINGSRVRLKDIVRLLANANIGVSGHHIISQGEADKILNATTQERRAMIEDALGLKVYQFKLDESVKRLQKTEENIQSIQSLRREIAPHLRFLKRQVEKIERARALRAELTALYQEYFKREDIYLKGWRKRIEQEKKRLQEELCILEQNIARIKETLSCRWQDSEKSAALISLRNSLRLVREKRECLLRDIGRLEGAISALEAEKGDKKENEQKRAKNVVPLDEVELLIERIDTKLKDIYDEVEPAAVRSGIEAVRVLVHDFLSRAVNSKDRVAETADLSKKLSAMKREKERIEEELKELKRQEDNLQKEHSVLQKDMEHEKESTRAAERTILKIEAKRQSLRSSLSLLYAKEEELNRAESDFKREIGEAAVLVGREAVDFENAVIKNPDGGGLDEESIINESRPLQVERRRAIERIKIRLEESGYSSSGDILKEFRETKERDEFLERELKDLIHSQASLQVLIDDLKRKLDKQFKEGLESINYQFNKFFSLQFPGGRASLCLVRDQSRRKSAAELLGQYDDMAEEAQEREEDIGEGIGIEIFLPHKRIRSLEMLSGGERALTSIALTFAISQVNPPPFLIFDETDAALDEANSRKYGDMIESLAERSQLILITHNRETMSRAGILYGVTMGSDGVSQLLSVKFDEAVAVAK